MTPAGSLLQNAAQRLTRDKADTLLLLAAALLVLLPHFAHLPLWTSATVCLALAWRASITLRGKRMPPVWLLLPISLATMGGVFYSFHTLLGREPGVAMLALLLTFKLLEMHARRDLFVVIFLSFFLLLTNFFYSQSMLTALSMVATIIMLLAAQITFQYSHTVPPLAQRLRLAGKVFLLAAPLALLLFVAFPRIQGPLWGLPGDANRGRTGMSDTMAPGSMSSLAQSDEVAFRVRFDGPVPQPQQLYWRGIVLSRYDGRTWSRIARPMRTLPPSTGPSRITWRGQAYRYEITQEASGKRFLFPLELTGTNLVVEEGRAYFTDELETIAADSLGNRMRYQGSAYTDYTAQPGLAPEELQRWLQLPAGRNPRTHEFAQSLAAMRLAQGDMAAVRQVLKVFREQKYQYTLEPPLLGPNAVDDFLFVTLQGFCEHYASAFTYLMRAAGIPARVVNGYQGGEFNPVDGYYTVRQSDAHAWSEVWIAGAGWVRVDPTAAVAPERVRLGLSGALPGSAGFGSFDSLRNNSQSWLGKMRFSLNAVNNAWNQWILDYNPTRQQNFLKALTDALGNWRTLAALAAVALLLTWAQRQRLARLADPVDAAYRSFCQLLARRGLARAPHEGPRSLAARVAALDLPEEKKAAMGGFLELYGALKYGVPKAEERTQSVKRLATLLNKSR